MAELVVDNKYYQADSTFQMEPVTEADIFKVVKSLKGKESYPRMDIIPPDIIKTKSESVTS